MARSLVAVLIVALLASCSGENPSWDSRISEASKQVESEAALRALAIEALEAQDEDGFRQVIDAMYDEARAMPDAAMSLAMLHIEDSEDFATLLRKNLLREITAKQEESEAEMSAITLGEARTKGALRVTFVSAEVRSILLDEDKNTGPLLWLTLDIENISEGQVVRPVNSHNLESCEYVDNYGNRHEFEFIETEAAPVNEIYDEKEVLPGESLRVYIPFTAPKVTVAKRFTADLYLTTTNEPVFVNKHANDRAKAIVLKFTRDQIRE